MTEQEKSVKSRCEQAINGLKEARLDGNISCDLYHECIELLGALPQFVEERNELAEKQIPKAVKVYEDKFCVCPSCECGICYKWEKYPTELTETIGLRYCIHCGQRLDWN